MDRIQHDERARLTRKSVCTINKMRIYNKPRSDTALTFADALRFVLSPERTASVAGFSLAIVLYDKPGESQFYSQCSLTGFTDPYIPTLFVRPTKLSVLNDVLLINHDEPYDGIYNIKLLGVKCVINALEKPEHFTSVLMQETADITHPLFGVHFRNLTGFPATIEVGRFIMIKVNAGIYE